MASNVKSLYANVYMAKLASSGLSEKDAKRLGIALLSDAGSVLPGCRGQAGIKLPYTDFTGALTGFFRVRLLTPPRSFAAEVAKPLRYVQPPDTGVAAYFPRTVGWQEVVADATVPLYVTEGEFKAACGCKHGFPTIGLGGVYSWRSAKAGTAFLPELDEIAWEGRHAYVVFDSDAQTNHSVMAALRHLCRELTERGAIPFVVKLPDLPGETKTGLDDLIVARGEEALREAVEAAQQYGLADELWKLNDRVCFVRDPGCVVELATGMMMGVQSFAREVYANLSYTEREDTPKGPRLVKKQTAAEWVRWPHRLEAARMTYRPGAERLADGELNTWRGGGVEPAAGDAGPWRELLDHLFGTGGAVAGIGDAAARRWFEQWCAYPVARPGAKLLTAAVLWGVHQGTGKSLVAYSLARVYGERNFSEVTQEDLQSSYNDWLVGKQLVLGEEITGSDRRAHADRLKALITQKTIRVSTKYVKSFTVPAVANFFFTSNHPDAFFLEDTDRRFFVWEVLARPLPAAFYARYMRWLRSAEGASALAHHLCGLDQDGFAPEGPAFETASKREMIDDNKSDLAAWVSRLRREPDGVLAECGLPEGADLLSTTQLLAMYDPGGLKRVTLNGMGRELKRSLVLRLPTVQFPSSRTTRRLYAVRNADRWARARPGEAARHWAERFKE